MLQIRIISILIFTIIISGCSRDDKYNGDAVTYTYEAGELLETEKLQDQRKLKWTAGANKEGNSEVFRALVIKYYSNPNKKYLTSGNFLTGDPQPELKGQALVLNKYKIGLEVNGVEQELKPGLNVVLISNIQKLTRFVIPPNEAKSFMEELQENNIDEFFETRILPHLTKNNKNAEQAR